MVKTLTEKGDTDYPVVKRGIYNAVVESVVEGENKFYKKDDGTPQIDVTFKFKITDEGEFKDQFVWGRTPPWFTNSPECKLRVWVQEILGVDELPIGFEFDFEDLKALRVQVTVDHTKTGKAKVTTLFRTDATAVSTEALTAKLGASVEQYDEEPF